MSVYLDKEQDYKKEKLEDLPLEIKNAVIKIYGDETDIEIYSILNGYHSIEINMDGSCEIFTSPDKTYIVERKNGCSKIYI